MSNYVSRDECRRRTAAEAIVVLENMLILPFQGGPVEGINQAITELQDHFGFKPDDSLLEHFRGKYH